MYFVYIILSCFTLGYTLNETKKNDPENLQNYCMHPDCSLENQHTMCVAVNKHSPRLYASGMTMWMRYQMLLLHNRHRDTIAMGLEAGQPPASNMRKMYWDYELERMAEVWARQCQKRHDECRNTIRFNVLQNMDVRAVLPRITEAQLLSDAVGAWFSGSRVLAPEHVTSFRLSNCSAPGGCNSHWYSAAAWASTWRLGCSQSLCTAKKRSCVLFHKKRKTYRNTSAGPQSDNMTDIRTPSMRENILRRTKYMTTTAYPRFDEFTAAKNAKESPLYRGILDDGSSKMKRREPKIIAFTFCNYGPAGNIDGFPIYDAGNTCSKCPQGTHCGDRTYRALCSFYGDPDGRS